MAAVAAKVILVPVILQTVGALVLIIAGILDRVEAKDRPQYIIFPFSFLVMPVWTGSLILITAGLGFIVVIKWNRSLRFVSSSVLPITVLVFKSLNITCAFLCGLIVFWYGATVVAAYAEHQAVKENPWVDDDAESSDDPNFTVMAIIFVMAIIEFFLCVMGAMPSRNRPSPYTQILVFKSLNITCAFLCGLIVFWLGATGVAAYAEYEAVKENPWVDDDTESSHDQTAAVMTIIFVMALIEFFLCVLGTMALQNSPSPNTQAGFQTQATANQPAAHVTSQASSPVLLVPAYPNQMEITEGPIMLLPTQNM